jgi:hypothetical protein
MLFNNVPFNHCLVPAQLNEIDFAIAWDWEYDVEFVQLLKARCADAGLTFLDITVYNLDDVMGKLQSGNLNIRIVLDRASDANVLFEPLQKFFKSSSSKVINAYDVALHTMDKSLVHVELLAAGLPVPETIILPALSQQETLDASLLDALSKFKMPCVVKPALGGGGVGVERNVQAVDTILASRKNFPFEKYLVQDRIMPRYCYGWRAWFRVYYVFGEVQYCWWDDADSHRYRLCSEADVVRYGLDELIRLSTHIARVAKMDFFSSEIALTPQGEFVVIDYVNDQCDMRLKSKHFDGVCDELVAFVVNGLIGMVTNRF